MRSLASRLSEPMHDRLRLTLLGGLGDAPDRQAVPNGSHEELHNPSAVAVRATETAGSAGSRYRPRSRSVKFRGVTMTREPSLHLARKQGRDAEVQTPPVREQCSGRLRPAGDHASSPALSDRRPGSTLPRCMEGSSAGDVSARGSGCLQAAGHGIAGDVEIVIASRQCRSRSVALLSFRLASTPSNRPRANRSACLQALDRLR
jgi:hypothetical protein